MILMVISGVAAIEAVVATALLWIVWKIFLRHKPWKLGDYGVVFGIAFIGMFVFNLRLFALSPH